MRPKREAPELGTAFVMQAGPGRTPPKPARTSGSSSGSGYTKSTGQTEGRHGLVRSALSNSISLAISVSLA